ncbi:hypothetical protein DYI25_05665 [Mesobacillus boroniphilus]|uniref:Uncharacterized protein n=1 Tax=Mesobacillus boroniphilus TaxID=308892 RepID=A0A944CIV4_9BACI|nr:hypothetical protein [Mesobacillus boroniphilus]MBS8263921.1 hypothetical protein [Mesobacillus boroniphilus]
MRKKKLFIGALLVIASLIMMGRDYYLAKEDKPPNFSILSNVYKDGGTKVYTGLGYKVIDYNQIDGRKDVVFVPFYVDAWVIK